MSLFIQENVFFVRASVISRFIIREKCSCVQREQRLRKRESDSGSSQFNSRETLQPSQTVMEHAVTLAEVLPVFTLELILERIGELFTTENPV